MSILASQVYVKTLEEQNAQRPDRSIFRRNRGYSFVVTALTQTTRNIVRGGYQRLRAEQRAHRLAAGQSDGVSAYRRESVSREQHQGHERTAYHEEQHTREAIAEHEEARVHLERDYAETYQLSRSYQGHGWGVVKGVGWDYD
jgi:hypothetical protein